MKKRKVIALILAVVMATTVFSGCTNQKTVVSIGDIKVSSKIFNYLMEYTRVSYEQQNSAIKSNPDLWNTYKQGGKTLIELARDRAKTYSTQIAVYLKKAKELNISLTDKEKKDVDSQISSEVKSAGGQTAFNESLKAYKIDYDTYKEIRSDFALMNKVNAQITKNLKVSDADIKATFEKNYVGVKHILFKSIDDSMKSLPQDKITAANAKAESVLKQLKAGANFDQMLTKYTEDKSGKSINSEVMVFDKNASMAPEFIAASFKLKVGQMSDVVRSQFGFHIIKRYDITSNGKYFTDNKATVKQALLEDKLNQEYKKWEKDYKVKTNDKYINSYKFDSKAVSTPSGSSNGSTSPSNSGSQNSGSTSTGK